MSDPKRLNKYISETGFCSRRDADRFIEKGRVTVNGKLPELGTKVTDDDDIKIDDKPLKAKPKQVYIAYNKPVGITCTTDSLVEDNIVKAIRYHERIFPIGRLDKPSEGLIFLTNEGDIVNKILRAGNQHEKEYIVTVDKPITKDFINKMANGLPILDTITKKCRVEQISSRTFKMVLTQGLNRQIRRMCEYLEYHVRTLKRVRIMNVELGDLQAGEWRHLTADEMAEINDSIKDSGKTEEQSVDHNKRPSSQPNQTNAQSPQHKTKRTRANTNNRNNDRNNEHSKRDNRFNNDQEQRHTQPRKKKPSKFARRS
ncbi:23S rRNA pseudouridine(2604) synthase RluF [Algibacillus agarilyticus]|uniref:23S rRNA pseudouridine(2604) synthase RluF n=1 Tax=Algibacillus agarilyticus TaxID=2234133 RepID=UPI000DD0A1A4|nr:23S rRNA pseudouridine(2604) synthase RluF [Algibacillus agarilyticus]